ncbi:MAG: hypothetical protein OEY14_18905 [Myxococcales bacterium]|nr:hypothetical protein [Myxococcales bacterium]
MSAAFPLDRTRAGEGASSCRGFLGASGGRPGALGITLSLLAALGLSACGTPGAGEGSLDSLFGAARAAEARDRVPDLYAQAEGALREARQAEDAAAADHRTRARLLLLAAIVESERIDHEERRLALEARERRALREAAALEAERAQLQERQGRELAAALALEQARLAFERAEGDEARRAGAGGQAERRLHLEAIESLRERTRLLVAAAAALGAEPSGTLALLDRLGADPSLEPGAALQRMDALHREALALLGRTRASRAGPGAGEIQALIEAAAEHGFAAEHGAEGLRLRLDGLFIGRATRPDPAKLGRLLELLSAHPHGPIRFELRGPGSAGALLRRRAASLGAPGALGSIERASVGLHGPDPAEPSRLGLDAIFVAYGAGSGVAPAAAAGSDQPR